MKRIALILGIIGLATTVIQAHTYVESSVLASGNIVKIQVPSTGIYRLSYEQIAALGINPAQVRLLGYGGNLIDQDFRKTRQDDVPSTPFYMEKGDDGVFSAGDYIIFYAKGPVDWKWDGSIYQRTRNYYADYGCYFLSDNVGEQRLITTSDTLQADSPYEVYTHTALQLHEQELINLVDVSGTAGGGREWYGESIASGKSKSVSFTFADAVVGQTLLCRVSAASTASQASSMTTRVGTASQKSTFVATSTTMQASSAELSLSTKITSSSMPVSISYTGQQSTHLVYLNYIEMQVPCTLRIRDNYLTIRNTEHLGQATLSRYHLLGADAATQVWNITDPSAAYRCNAQWQGDTLCWLGSNLTPQVFVVVRTNSEFATPASRGKVYNQNIHQQLRGKQHVILSPEHLRSQAERLKQLHEQQTPDEHWVVVSDEEVYNEFSSGTPDASAIRWMMKYLWDTYNNTSQAPKTLLLFGDGSFDNRQILKSSGTPTLLTYQAHNSTSNPSAYACDDYFGWLMDNAGIKGNSWKDDIATMQIGVGRLPVTTYEQAEQMVNKIATYMTDANSGSWKQRLCFLADDGDAGDHVKSAEKAAKEVSGLYPEYIVNKIYLDAYEQEATSSGERYPNAESAFYNLLQSGVMLMDYAGHGSPNYICSELFLTRNIVENLTNTNLGLWTLVTCSYAQFDQSNLSSAELAVLNANGGAIAVISSDRIAYVGPNENLNRYICINLFTKRSDGTYSNTLGEVLRLSKNQMGVDANKLCYVLLGDPALKLNYPAPYQVIVTQMPDTLRALDLVTIEGYVANANKDTVPFNGEVTVNIYDKQQTLYTRDNDQTDPSKKTIIEYKDYPYLLFVGQALVENSKFSMQFRMPKDMKYNVDYARLTLYATGEDAAGPAEALGHSEAFKVGGSSPILIDDTEGPEMDLYLNSPFFKDGNEVNATPHFYANLRDKNGINTAGSGIGHDLLLTVDNNVKQTYVLNSYYSSASGSYQEGLVSYPMSTLSDGQHTLTFRACDMLNNATTKSLGFYVNKDLSPEVKQVLVYPNPVAHDGDLTLFLQYDRPDDLVAIDLTFYDLTGHTIWSTTRNLYGYNGQASLNFNLSQTNLPTGVYIYQFRIQTSTQSSSRHSGRVIVY